MRNDQTSPMTGSFWVDNERIIFGHLSLSGEDSLLYLRDDYHFKTNHLLHSDIHGSLHDLRKVSLIDCICPSEQGRYGGPTGIYYFSEIFPHYVLTGSDHLKSSDKRIIGISFTIEDATSVLYDFDTFSTVLNAKDYIHELVNSNTHDREVEVGSNPIIGYYTGKHTIFQSKTSIGTVYATHAPSFSLGGPSGINIENTIFINIDFDQPLEFKECLDRTYSVCQFFEIMAGRPQKMHRWHLRLDSSSIDAPVLEVYSSMQSAKERLAEERGVHPADVPLDGARQPDHFSNVLALWLERQPSWKEARGRYLNCLRKRNLYDADRIVAAANMFDILPDAAVESEVVISDELADAKRRCRAILKELPKGQEREGALNLLGRIGRSGLKQKVRQRTGLVMKKVEDVFPDLYIVADAAVDCRNHYVHGPPSGSKIDYSAHTDMLAFLTDTLEFIFCASDLVEAGWDIGEYIGRGTTMTHPLGAYRVKYSEDIQKLRELRGFTAA